MRFAPANPAIADMNIHAAAGRGTGGMSEGVTSTTPL
jgi:hypothetical protein